MCMRYTLERNVEYVPNQVLVVTVSLGCEVQPVLVPVFMPKDITFSVFRLQRRAIFRLVKC